MTRLLLLAETLLLCGIAVGEEPIRHLPPIDATQSSDARYDVPRLGARPPVDPLPPTGANLDVLGSQTHAYPEFGDEEAWLHVEHLPQLPTVLQDHHHQKLTPHKDTFFQKASFTATWIDGGRIGDMGVTELETYITVAVPLPTTDFPMTITTAFEVDFFKGPISPDVPGQVYSTYMQFIWLPTIGKRWRGMFGIEPGLYGDYEGGDAFRLLGRALLRYEIAPDKFQLVAGALYLDREDINILPAGGINWYPSDDWKIELIYPRPKAARRVHRGYTLGFTAPVEYWVYAAGEFGGDSWAVRRASGAQDRLTEFDIRVLLGLERRLNGGAGARVEVGYVFERRIEYASSPTEFDFPSTFLLRGGVTY